MKDQQGNINEMSTPPNNLLPLKELPTLRILLADDDEDDCLFFKDALAELPIPAQLTAVHDGEQLMQQLKQNSDTLPHMVFLDLNMPRKNGWQCLSEIRQNDKLKELPVIILSTSFEEGKMNQLYKNEVTFYFNKPQEFSMLKILISNVITLTTQQPLKLPTKENLVFTEDF